MAIKAYRPITPAQRQKTTEDYDQITTKKPMKSLLAAKKQQAGKNNQGRITVRHRGGGVKRHYRIITYKLPENLTFTVEEIEYDPNRSANIALLSYVDGEKRYILATHKMSAGSRVISSNDAQSEFTDGMSLPLSLIPQGVMVHAIELEPGKGAQLVRSAGGAAQLVAVEGDRATLKMPSGEIRLIDARCRATIGRVGNVEHQNVVLGKAGRARWKGRRPSVRGCAMNPIDHPMGGGQTGGGNHPVSPWGQLAKGYVTRKRRNKTDRFILVRRNGKKVKKG